MNKDIQVNLSKFVGAIFEVNQQDEFNPDIIWEGFVVNNTGYIDDIPCFGG